MKSDWIVEVVPSLWSKAVKQFYGRDFIDEIVSQTIEYVLVSKTEFKNYEQFKQYSMTTLLRTGLNIVTDKVEEPVNFNGEQEEEVFATHKSLSDYHQTTGACKKELETIVDKMVKKKRFSAKYGKMLKLRLYNTSYTDIADQFKLTRGAVSLAFSRTIVPALKKEIDRIWDDKELVYYENRII